MVRAQSKRKNAGESESKLQVWTIGHSTRSAEEFLQLLKSYSIEALADVRSFPGSRRYPQFNKEQLAKTLEDEHIAYFHLPEIGGRRTARKDSKNTAWRNASFRGYADYMETPEFQQGIERFLRIAREQRTAIMCAEAVWWRCHRSLISDYLKARGIEVIHIIGIDKAQEHPYTSAARIVDGALSYEGLLAGSAPD